MSARRVTRLRVVGKHAPRRAPNRSGLELRRPSGSSHADYPLLGVPGLATRSTSLAGGHASAASRRMVGGGPAGVGGVSGGAGAGVPAGDRGLEVSEAGGSPDHRTAPGGF